MQLAVEICWEYLQSSTDAPSLLASHTSGSSKALDASILGAWRLPSCPCPSGVSFKRCKNLTVFVLNRVKEGMGQQCSAGLTKLATRQRAQLQCVQTHFFRLDTKCCSVQKLKMTHESRNQLCQSAANPCFKGGPSQVHLLHHVLHGEQITKMATLPFATRCYPSAWVVICVLAPRLRKVLRASSSSLGNKKVQLIQLVQYGSILSNWQTK